MVAKYLIGVNLSCYFNHGVKTFFLEVLPMLMFCRFVFLIIIPLTLFVQKTASQSSSVTVTKDSLPSLHFYPKSTKLSDRAHKKVKAVARFLKQHPSIRMEVRGYSDADDNLDEAKELARKRAKKVYIALMGEQVASERVEQTVMLPQVESSKDSLVDKSKRQVDFAIIKDYACDHIDLSSFIEEKARKYQYYKNMAGYGDLKRDGLRYRIQIASVPSDASYDPGLPGEFTLHKEAYGEFTRYMVGEYPTFCQAIHWWDEMSQHGVEQVWIVAYYEGVRLSSLQRARNLLKETSE